MDNYDHNNNLNVHDHSGYSPKELFITNKYESFKEEIQNYNDYLPFDVYQTDIISKVNLYQLTNKCRCMRSMKKDTANCDFVNLEYGLYDESPVQFNHLLALILYTDYTELSYQFSLTFRGLDMFETLESIKSRNSKYFWMSKYLREMVQFYGERTENLVTYCGLSFILVFPELEIRLCGPTSTSTKISVATRFGGDKGILVQFNANVDYHHFLRGFNCSWISRYKEEAEVLYFGGHYRISVGSIRIIKTHKNYAKQFNVLKKFNRMFIGGEIYKIEDGSSEESLITKLLHLKIGLVKFDNVDNKNIDKYVYDTFLGFIESRRHIVINGKYWLFKDKDYVNISIRNLFMFNERKQYYYHAVNHIKFDDDDSCVNLFRDTIFKIFDNIEQITIYTTQYDGYYFYGFSLLYLLKIISKSHNLNKIIIIAARYGSHQYLDRDKIESKSWLSQLWDDSLIIISNEYKKNGYYISKHDTVTNRDLYKEDTVVISKI